jgi:hypothetical protein
MRATVLEKIHGKRESAEQREDNKRLRCVKGNTLCSNRVHLLCILCAEQIDNGQHGRALLRAATTATCFRRYAQNVLMA